MSRFALFLLLLVDCPGYAQETRPPGGSGFPALTLLSTGWVNWSAQRQLQVNDFPRRIPAGYITQQSTQAREGPTFVLAMLSRKLRKELGNRAVINAFCRATALHLTPVEVELSQDLRCHQTQWDINEVTARRLRQQLQARARPHRPLGKAAAEKLYRAALAANYQCQAQYFAETQRGRLSEKQQEWENQIARELNELAAFAVPD